MELYNLINTYSEKFIPVFIRVAVILSFISHYDKYLIDKGLMEWVDNVDMLVHVAQTIIGERKENLAKSVYGEMSFDEVSIVKDILELLG